ncbi:MAG TPA: hypothetical protein DD811_04845 [Syntrophomonas sp.]|jgi:hypothetical protein|nr:hypothetical protein [Syntrophomonas sp.]
MASFLALPLGVLSISLHINTLLPSFTKMPSFTLANTGYFCHKALLKPEPDTNTHIYQKVRDGMNRILILKEAQKYKIRRYI